MLTINTNLSSLIAQASLKQSTSLLNQAIERMTTGYKINQAKDNAANYAIVEDLNSRISSMLQVQSNAEDGVSMLSTADGGLNLMRDILQRIRDLAVQASNENYGTTSRDAMQAEADALIEQITQIKKTTQYNGLNLYERPVEIEDPAAASYAINPIDDTAYAIKSSEDEASLTTENTTLDQPMMSYSAAPMSLDAGIATASADDILGTVDIAYNTTVNVNIDGVIYTVTNNQAGTQSFSYLKDTATGVVSITCNNMTIVGQADKAHNIYLKGSNNELTTGNLQDNIELDGTCTQTTIYAGAENDTIIASIDSIHTTVYGEDGDDTIIGAYQYIYGGNGNDNITANRPDAAIYNTTCYGEGGNDTINVSGGGFRIYGGDGDDDFTISGYQNIIDGGAGSNTIVDNGSKTIKANVPGANTLLATFSANETKTILINNISYEITNNKNEEQVFLYSVDADNKITFNSSDFIIRGDLNKSHNVILNNTKLTFYGGNQKDYIHVKYGSLAKVYGLDGDDEITSSFAYANIYGGKGNDIIKIDAMSSYSYFSGEEGDDVYHVTDANNSTYGTTFYDTEGEDEYYLQDSCEHITVIDTDGAKTFSGVTDLSDYKIYGIDGYQNMDGYIEITGDETKNITINDRNFQITSRLGEKPSYVLAYKYDSTKDTVIFSGQACIITATDTDKDYSVELYGSYVYYRGTDNVDKVVAHCYASNIATYGGNDEIYSYKNDSSVYAGAGDDYIYAINTRVSGGSGNDTIDWYNSLNYYTANGDDGDDTINVYGSAPVLDSGGNNIYNVNIDGASVSGGDGNDTFYVNGNNNSVNCGGGNDYIVINGQYNTVNGESGTNYYVDNSGGTSTVLNSIADGIDQINFTTLNETKEVVFKGKTYTVRNLVNGSNTIKFSQNPNTGIITVTGSGLEIISANDQQNELYIQGSNNIYQGSNLIDKITITTGSNNTINGNAGNDILTSDSENNSILGGADADTININKSTNLTVDGGNGNDTININSNNNTQIKTGSDNDTVNINGENNKLTTQDGDNKIQVTGGANTIQAQNGNNDLAILSSDNIVTLGSGNNTLGIAGNSNTVTANKISNKIIIEGNDNNVTQTNGDNEVRIIGTGNDYTSTLGQKNVSVSGNGNTIITGTSNDVFKITGNSNSITSLNGENEFSINGDTNQAQGGSGVDDFKIKGNSNTAMGGDSNDTFMISKGNYNNINGEAGDQNTLVDNGRSTTYTNVINLSPEVFDYAIKVGIGYSDSSYIKGSISFNLFDFSVDFSTAESALECIDEIDGLLVNINEQLSNIGAAINRLEMAIEEQNIKIENMISTRSTLRDADIAKVSSEYIRQQILQQACATLLSTANQTPNIALGLI